MKRKKLHQRGFTLIELLLVIAIIGLIAAMIIPNLLDAMQKAKQKRTVADEKLVGTAMMAWLTDQTGAAAAGANATADFTIAAYPEITVTDLEAQIVPQYIQAIPLRDGWNQDYQFRLNVADPGATRVMAIRSMGRDLAFDGDQYTTGGFNPTDYDRDIVWADGFFVRWPDGIAANEDQS